MTESAGSGAIAQLRQRLLDARRNDDRVEITIRDNGPGIDPILRFSPLEAFELPPDEIAKRLLKQVPGRNFILFFSLTLI